ncbi:glutathione-dependent formaldehyde-activating, GFA [Ustulina deusta]|nr:glutathione-dependent formaldehyde-activating, GFA [Ustulina deusta]
MSSDPLASSNKYDANCHCGMVRFSVTTQDLKSSTIVSCNCSICTKNGYLFVYPKCKDVVFVSGEFHMASYRFGNEKKRHKFCPTCGTSILIDFSGSDRDIEREVTAINIRTFVEVEELMKDLHFKSVDGKNKLGPAYSVENA